MRLSQGDYDRETVFADDPATVAQRWQAAGARRLHLVDLDGARAGKPVNTDAVRRIAAAVQTPLQLGGGLRDIESLRLYTEIGIDRLILGTAALKDRPLLVQALAEFGDRLAVGIDARNGFVATEGWLDVSQVAAVDLLRALAALGVRRFIYTDIARDGMLGGPNLSALAAVVRALGGAGAAVIASGGIASVQHLQDVAALGVEGAIIGKALYTGALGLAEALRALQSP